MKVKHCLLLSFAALLIFLSVVIGVFCFVELNNRFDDAKLQDVPAVPRWFMIYRDKHIYLGHIKQLNKRLRWAKATVLKISNTICSRFGVLIVTNVIFTLSVLLCAIGIYIHKRSAKKVREALDFKKTYDFQKACEEEEMAMLHTSIYDTPWASHSSNVNLSNSNFRLFSERLI